MLFFRIIRRRYDSCNRSSASIMPQTINANSRQNSVVPKRSFTSRHVHDAVNIALNGRLRGTAAVYSDWSLLEEQFLNLYLK